mgnify:CR=1 FL=1
MTEIQDQISTAAGSVRKLLTKMGADRRPKGDPRELTPEEISECFDGILRLFMLQVEAAQRTAAAMEKLVATISSMADPETSDSA